MRVDLLLKSLCLVKTRSQGRTGCEAGCISVNGRPAKPSTEIRAGDVIEIRHPRNIMAVEITAVPDGQVARKECGLFYRVVRETAIEGSDGEGWDG